MVVGVSAVGLRVVAVPAGLPYLGHPDEPVNLAVARRMVEERSLNPRFFDYPSLAYDLQAFAHAVYRLIADVVGDGAPMRVMESVNLAVARAIDPGAVVVARSVTLVVSLAVVVLTGWLTRLVGGDRRTVLLAAALAAFSALLVEHAALVTPDTLTAATTTLALCAAMRLRTSGSLAAYLFAGASVGLAAASKYNAVIVAVAVVVVHLMRSERVHRRMVQAAVAAVAAFLVVCPYVVLDASTFWMNLRSVLSHYSTGHDGYEGNSWVVNLGWLAAAFGPLLVVAMVPVIREVTARRAPTGRAVDDPTVVPVAAFVGAAFVLVSAQQVRFERNLLPLAPAVVVLVAIGVRQVVARAAVSSAMRRRMVLTVLAAAACWYAVNGVTASVVAARSPTAETRAWIEANVPAGSVIVVDSYGPFLDGERWKLVHPRYSLVESDTTFGASPDVVIVTRSGSGRYLGLDDDKGAAATLAALVKAACDDQTFDRDTVRVFVLRCSG